MRKQFEFKEGWLLLGLVAAMAVSPAVAMRWADWVPGLWVLQAVSLIAVLAGFLLAKSRFLAGTAFLLGLIYGIFAVGFFSGLLLSPDLPWHEKIPQLLSRQAHWLVKAANVILNPDAADTSRDGLIFIMQTALILWLLGYAAAWYTFRRPRIWQAILPSGVLLLLTEINYYGPEPLGIVQIAFSFCALLYIVGSHYFVREQDWARSRVVYNQETRLDFIQTGFLIALAATLVAWVVPNVSAGSILQEWTRPVDSAWQRVQDGWTQLFASMKSYGGEYADPFGNSLALGGPRQIAPLAVMDVKANAGRYWRGAIYDTYTGDGWVSTAETRLMVDPDRPLELHTYRYREPITATITNYWPNTGLVYFPHQPQRTDRQAKFTVFDAGGDPYDPVNVLARYVIYEGMNYKVWGSTTTATDNLLRRTGTDYPEWVRERYLQLPPTSSPRVVELAAAIANPHPTPFDKAEALTGWLRANLTYNEEVQAPPDNVDPLEHLLFESQEGYCNYYASALTVMLRSQGIPARMAAGYVRGSWLEDLGVHRVYSNDAHTWVEVFFPDIGWVEFEPTAAQPAIVRTAAGAGGPGGGTESDSNLPEEGPDLLAEEEMIRDLGDGGDNDAPLADEAAVSNLGLLVGGAVLLLALLAGGLVLLADRRRGAGTSPVAQVYYQMCRFARWLGVQLLPTQTPHERAGVLVAAVSEAAAPIDVITDMYVEERFGLAREGIYDERAGHAWRELWPTLLQKSLLRYLARFQRDEAER